MMRCMLYVCMSFLSVQEFMENFRKAREDEETNRAMRASKKLQEDQDAEEVSHVAARFRN